jgi:hypothetical protein
MYKPKHKTIWEFIPLINDPTPDEIREILTGTNKETIERAKQVLEEFKARKNATT